MFALFGPTIHELLELVEQMLISERRPVGRARSTAGS